MPVLAFSQECADVPAKLQAISRSLNVCGAVKAIANKTGDMAANQLRVQAAISIGAAHVNSTAVSLLESERKQALLPQQKLGIAGGIIGFLGGGAGGGLHLINNPQVGHAATLVGIGAGVLGGSIAVYSAYKYGRGNSNKTATALVVTRYEAALRPELAATRSKIETVEANPAHLSDVLAKMAGDLDLLEGCVSEPDTCRQ